MTSKYIAFNTGFKDSLVYNKTISIYISNCFRSFMTAFYSVTCNSNNCMCGQKSYFHSKHCFC